MIDRIAKLLNQAERAATPEEAAAFFEKAQSLATAHSISLAKARLHTHAGSQRLRPVNTTIRIGEPRRHANRHLVLLMSAIAQANDLKMDVAHNSTYVILYGFADDITAAQELWIRIATQMVRFGEQYLATGQWRSDTRMVLQGGYAVQGAMTKQTARATYYSAFIATVGERITRARDQAVRRAEQADRLHPGGSEARADPAADPQVSSTALALRAKEHDVSEFYGTASSARGTWGGGRSRVLGLSESARQAGRRDGARVQLTRAGEVSGPPKAVGA